MAQYISVKRNQQTNKHAPLAIMLCLLLLFSSFVFSFADETSVYQLMTVDGNYSPSYTTQKDYSWALYNGSYYLSAAVKPAAGDIDFYLFRVGANVYLVCDGDAEIDTSSTTVLATVAYKTDSTLQFTGNTALLNSANNLYYVTIDSSQVQYATVYCPTYSSANEGYQAIRAYIDSLNSGGGITNNGNAIIVVNPGNVAYIGYDSATFNFLINLSKPVSSLNSNARYGFATELPSGVLTFTPSSGNALPLRKSIPDLLGRSATWVGFVDTDTVGYFIVYNPVYDLNGNTNPPIRVTVTVGYMNVTQFPLTASDIGGDIISTGNSDNFYISDGLQGGTDLPSYIYSQTDQNGNVTTSSALTVPVTPYNYTEPSAGTAESGLQGFIQQILDLLSAPIKLIQNLYDSAVGFFNYLSSLWSWLPPELTTIIVSALGVLVVIGVVKFLWK